MNDCMTKAFLVAGVREVYSVFDNYNGLSQRARALVDRFLFNAMNKFFIPRLINCPRPLR